MTSLAELPLVLDVSRAAAILGISRWAMYEAIKRGEVRVVRLGRTIRVPRAALAELLGEPEPAAAGE